MASRSNASATAGDRTLRNDVQQITSATDQLSRITDAVHDGIGVQVKSLDQMAGNANETTASLKATAAQAASIATSSEQLASSVNEMAASTEQVNASTGKLNSAIAEIGTAVEQSISSTPVLTNVSKK